MDFKQVLAEKKPIIWQEVQKYLLKDGPFGFSDIVNEYPKRQGKYGRGTLVLLACEAFGGDARKAVRTAAAMQMSEDWILSHDDWMDSSEERRGKPTLHKMYGDQFAVNAGDALHMRMWRILVDNRDILDEKTTFRVMKEFLRFLEITASGQHLELSLMFKKPLEELDYKDYEDVVYGKTCEYTIAGPLRLGAIIAGKGDDVLNKLSEVGILLGRGFQIRDDLLNVVGDSKSYGKEIGGDIAEGKRTLMLIHLIKNTKGEERKKVLEIMKKERNKRGPDDIKYIIELMKKRGSIEFGEKKAEEYAKEAKQKFNNYFSNVLNKEVFEAAIDFFAMKREV